MSGAPLVALLLLAAPEVRVGSKKFTESVILGEVATRLLAASGVPARHLSELGGSRVLWDALLRGDLDLYPEYTGTLQQELLAGEALPDEAALRAALARRGLALGPALGFQDTYAIGLPRARARALGLSKLSELAAHPELRLGLSHEFLERADGWPALRDRYGLRPALVRGLDHDLAYRALAEGAIDATDLYSTDAEIQAYDLVTLADDRHAFPEYQAVLLERADLANRAPEAAAALERLRGALSAEQMVGLNARAKLGREPPGEVAAVFLRERLGLAGGAAEPGLGARLWARSREHLGLVGLSLLLAIAAALPLGVAAARWPRAGRALLGAVGVVQTIPSLALLVFMIPLLGIGARPAILALFLYSLLPIVRNTHAGLTGIAPVLRDSAEALGLPVGARLWRVELPLAAPAILAGIRTAAVINVGTATLGALIGAGGYGQPILAGIRLDDTWLILEGAVPAALLALGVEWLLEGVERRALPRGLRGR